MTNPWILLLIPVIPGLSAAVLALLGKRLPYNFLGGLASLAVGISLALTLGFCKAGVFGAGQPIDFSAGPWIATQGFQTGLHLHLNSVSLAMCLLVTGFGFLITVYSIGYMRHDTEQYRFFASLNLFVAAMLTLVLADNLVLLFLGWEGVGLCSYLLIGHYWEKEDVPVAAFRAFFVNRIGDVAFLLGVFSIYRMFGTVSLSELETHGAGLAGIYHGKATLAALLLLGGAFAKSAQAPLHVWLADAMAGPTPVSALIHAATMVTAGIYLIMRLDWLYAVAPEARLVVAVCALVTLVVGAALALVQTDIKKILAYSTLSNLALMFLALAAHSSAAAMLHLFGHAFFKALLFLAAGSVILAAHHEQDVRHLKGVLKKLPITNLAFLIGCVGGAGLLPFLSAGFFSKEAVLGSLEEAQFMGWGLYLPSNFVYWVVVAVECVSVLYLFRLYGYLRSDAADSSHHGEVKETSLSIKFVLAVLAAAAPLFGYFSATPRFGGNGFLYAVLTGGGVEESGPSFTHVLPFLIVNIVLAGVCFFFFSTSKVREPWLAKLRPLRMGNYGPLSRKFYFDDCYEYAILIPLKAAAYLSRLILESIFSGYLSAGGWLSKGLSHVLRLLQTGKANQYAMVVLVAVFLLAYYLGGR